VRGYPIFFAHLACAWVHLIIRLAGSRQAEDAVRDAHLDLVIVAREMLPIQYARAVMR
jgi:hypothetical protein